MQRRQFLFGAAALAATAVMKPLEAMSFPSVFPHGTTIYKPEKCFSGYTLFGTEVYDEGTVLINMNGDVVKQWTNIGQEEHPPMLLKGGNIVGAKRLAPDKRGRLWGDEHSTDLVVVDWDGKEKRNIPHAGMHHDFQFNGNSCYYSPERPMDSYKGKMLILSHKFVHNEKISDKELYDDYIVEVDENGKVVWDWLASDHFDEMNFPEEFKRTMYKYPTYSMTRTPGKRGGDWIHVNTTSYLGPNKWYDEDPEKYAMFNPENILISGRQTNTMHIIDKKTGKIVWQLGPYYYPDTMWTFNGKNYKRAYKKLGQIIGQHHAHMIPKGLPGEGNIMIYDNGGYAGYGPRNPGAPLGWSDARRDYSRVIEIDPRTLKIVWEHSAKQLGLRNKYMFYSDYVSSAQRLPNGNTLITNGSIGQFQEVTKDNEIVWEYISPFYSEHGNYNLVYRAYLVPYDFVPQLKKPQEKEVIPPAGTALHLIKKG